MNIFQELPIRVLLRIMIDMELEELLTLRQLNKRMNSLIQSQWLWRKKILKEYPQFNVNSNRLKQHKLIFIYKLLKDNKLLSFGKNKLGSLGTLEEKGKVYYELNGLKQIRIFRNGNLFSLILCNDNLYFFGCINPIKNSVNTMLFPICINHLLNYINLINFRCGSEHALILDQRHQLYLLKDINMNIMPIKLDFKYNKILLFECGENGNIILLEPLSLIRFDFDYNSFTFNYYNLMLPKLNKSEKIIKLGCNKNYSFIITNQQRAYIYYNPTSPNYNTTLNEYIYLRGDKTILGFNISTILKLQIKDIKLKDHIIYLLSNENLLLWCELNNTLKICGSICIGNKQTLQLKAFYLYKQFIYFQSNEGELIKLKVLQDTKIYNKQLNRISTIKEKDKYFLKFFNQIYPDLSYELDSSLFLFNFFTAPHNFFAQVLDLNLIPKSFYETIEE